MIQKRHTSLRRTEERTGESMIEVQQMIRHCGKDFALQVPELKLNNGKVYGILGKSGAGKSTLLQLLAGVLLPSEGEVRINGFDTLRESKAAKRCIGYLPAPWEPYGAMSAYELLSFAAEARGISYERAQRQVHELLELTDTDACKHRPLCKLSELERRRVGLAQTLLGSAEILLLDEPTEGLSKKEAAKLLALIRAVKEKRTVFLASSSPDTLSQLCDHVLVLSDGALIANAPIESLSLPEIYDTLQEAAPRKRQRRLMPPAAETDGEYELIEVSGKEKD